MADQSLIDEIKTAYKVHRLRPVRGFFFVHRKRYDFACPLVALALYRGVVNRADPEIARDDGANAAIEWSAQAFGEEWTMGVIDGFDKQTERADDPEYLQGYNLGVALADQILPGDLALGGNRTKNQCNEDEE